jgi:NADPH-dependent glutamate synthase beta subunit-like oxidoreductase
VAVCGGGNAAIDSARSALRLGAEEVTILYRRTAGEMPASFEEVVQTIDEGIKIEYLVNPVRISKAGNALEVECIRMQLGSIDASGRRRPEPIEGSEFKMIFDNVIEAIGQQPDIPEQFGLPVGQGNTIVVDEDTLATGKKGIYAGGDVVSGPASVIEAIAQGRQAAISIDKYLGGSGEIDQTLVPPEKELPPLEESEEQRRPDITMLPVSQRIKDFTEVEVCYSREDAIEEANRCLRCDLEERDED